MVTEIEWTSSMSRAWTPTSASVCDADFILIGWPHDGGYVVAASDQLSRVEIEAMYVSDPAGITFDISARTSYKALFFVYGDTYAQAISRVAKEISALKPAVVDHKDRLQEVLGDIIDDEFVGPPHGLVERLAEAVVADIEGWNQ